MTGFLEKGLRDDERSLTRQHERLVRTEVYFPAVVSLSFLIAHIAIPSPEARGHLLHRPGLLRTGHNTSLSPASHRLSR